MSNALIEAASTEIAEYNATEAGLMALRQRMEGVQYDVTTVKGMVIAKADRAEVRGLRTGLEAMRKQIKAPALAHAKLIDDEAKRITAALLELETPIDEQIKARELTLENERLARERAERDRVTAIHNRIAVIRGHHAKAAMCRTAAEVLALSDALIEVDMEGFSEFEMEAKTAHAATLEAVDQIAKVKAFEEAERTRIAAEQAAAAEVLRLARAELEAERAALGVITKQNRDAAVAEADKIAIARQALEDAQRQAAVPAPAEPTYRAPPAMRTAEPVVIVPVVPVAELAIEPYYNSHAPTSADIYSMCCESDTADQFAKWLCHCAGVPFPPVNEGVTA